MTENYPEYFVAIRYNIGSSNPYYLYNPSESAARVLYYPPHYDGNYYTPYAWIDGIIRGSYTYNAWWSFIEARYYDESPLEIILGGVYNDDLREGTLTITVVATGFIEWTNLKLRVALTESNIYWRAPNGSVWHNQAMRDMIPTADGAPINISQGDTVELSQDFSCPSPLVPSNCQLVVFVQADNGREILQTSAVWIDSLGGPVFVDEEGAEVPNRFELAQNYPNPFNACTKIDYVIGNESHVELAVYDLNGRKVATLIDGIRNPGHHQAVWDGTDSEGNEVSSGIYFYKLVAAGKNLGKRMVLLK